MQTYYSVLNRQFSDLNPVCYGFEACLSGHSYGFAVRDYYLIHFIFSGRGRFMHAGEEQTLGEGSVFLIRPGEHTLYSADRAEPWQYAWIGFDGALCESLLAQTGFRDGVRHFYAPQARALFEDLHRIPDRLPSTELMLCARLYELLALLQPALPPQGSLSADYARRAVDYIKSNYAMPIRVDGIAEMLHLNRRYLSRLFLRHTGFTPQDYLVRYRLSKAAELLKSGRFTVTEAARSVGYEDSAHFSKIFKSRFGISPSHMISGAESDLSAPN